MSSTTPAAPLVPLRLRHVDSLRAVAAGTVMWSHFAGGLAPFSVVGETVSTFLNTLPFRLDLGRIGVMIFFAISGFVICRSFGGPREGATRRFLIRRFCRLYPAFWASMVPGAFFWWLGGKALTWPLLAGTATMLSSAFGLPHLIRVYWTLEIELSFYALCLGFYHLGWLDRRWLLGGLVLALAILPRSVHVAGKLLGNPHLTLPGKECTWLISLAVMFWGATVRLVYDETGGFRRKPLANAGTWWVLFLAPATVDFFNPDLKRQWLGGHGEEALFGTSIAFALAIFAVWVALLRVEFRPLTYLGVISYSLYLFHLPVMYLCSAAIQAAQSRGWLSPWPLWVTMGLCGSLTVALCALTYRWVERPAIALGKRLTGTDRQLN